MAEITANLVKELRDKTDAPMMECKKALIEADGDMARAEEILRIKLGNKASKAATRVAAEGVVGIHVSPDATVAAMVEVNCETDFVARTDEFRELVRDLAMHIAAADPRYLSRDEVTADVLAKEREIFRQRALDEGKPANVVDRIVEGRVGKFYAETVLLEQPFVKDPDKTVEQVITEKIATIKENIRVRRFARFQLGEGIEKRKDDFAAEVAAQAGAGA